MNNKTVLGIDLAKTTLPDAIAMMVDAWYQAQNIEEEMSPTPLRQRAKSNSPSPLERRNCLTGISTFVSFSKAAQILGMKSRSTLYRMKSCGALVAYLRPSSSNLGSDLLELSPEGLPNLADAVAVFQGWQIPANEQGGGLA
jgi:hypothetical protein